jgi:hypothetical protein
MIKEA